MLVRFLILLFVLGTIYAQTYNCKSVYNPSDYNGNPRVPIDCEVEQLDCPASWKSGIPQGSETSAPMIYQKFLNCHEGFTLCGYVPIDPNSGAALGQSGVTIGRVVDLGSKSRTSFTSLSSTILNKLEPYFGLKGNLAACAAIERPLNLTLSEANTLTDAATTDVIDEVSQRYDSEKDANATAFASLPRGIRTAIFSVWYQFGNPSAYPKFWGFVTKNEWDNAINELRKFYTNDSKDPDRRTDEADIIEATLLKCNRSLDVVFLMDVSGSIGRENFPKTLDFVKTMIKAFPDDKLGGKNGTRFGLSTFDDYYRPQFYLSNYTSQSAYLSAVSRVFYDGGNTRLGRALRNISTDQFTEERGLRPDVDGVPRVLIVLTDGWSQDNVSIPAKNVRDKNIVIYAIGIELNNLLQLKEIASSDSHVYMLSSFTQLDTFISTLTASTCYEPRSASLNKTIITNVKQDTYQYFSYKVKPSSNLKISVVDLIGSTLVYASRTNPHPYKYDYDIVFDLSTQTNKIIVISPIIPAPNTKVKRSADELEREIYVSVTSDTKSASFEIQANECNPLNCTEGTNEMPTTTQPPTTQLPTTPSATQTAETPTSSARVVAGTKFLVVCFVMLVTLVQTYDI